MRVRIHTCECTPPNRKKIIRFFTTKKPFDIEASTVLNILYIIENILKYVSNYCMKLTSTCLPQVHFSDIGYWVRCLERIRERLFRAKISLHINRLIFYVIAGMHIMYL